MTEEAFVESVHRWLNGNLDEAGFAELQKQLREAPGRRREFLRLANLDSGLRDLALPDLPVPGPVPLARPVFSRVGLVAMAAALVFLALASWMVLSEPVAGDAVATSGVAVITAEAGAVWKKGNGPALRKGVPLQPGTIQLLEGLAQIDFYGGASISLSAPAALELVTGDRAVLHRGRLRADVPPAARGFEVKAGEVVLEDLGTTFGLAVHEDDTADLIVFDGEVVAHGVSGDPLSLQDGESALLTGGTARRQAPAEIGHFPDIEDVFAGSGNRENLRYAVWKEASLELRRDPRLIAYYDFENLTPVSRRLKNRAPSGSELDGGIVGARVAPGRWPDKTALDFRLEGDRVRFDIPGEFSGLTLFAWVRIDALDRHLNSLFLTDYYDENEFHWQISSLGALHFASSPRGVEDLEANNRRFYSDRFWDPGKSGQWIHLATTVAMGSGGVTHYINGKAVGFSGGTNMSKPLERLRIGGADLGNWSEPIWETALRTLNGRIDEFALFDSPLDPEEIRTIYENGKP